METIGYIRVSTSKQDGEGQRAVINEYCAKNGMKLDRIEFEQISSRKEKREIYNIVERLGEGDRLIVSEISRLGRRSVMEINEIIKKILDKKASLVVVNDNMNIKDGTPDIATETMIFALGLAGRIEREFNSERIKNALRAKQEKGVKLGRPKGGNKLDGREEEINKYLDMGLNKVSIAKLMGVNRVTLYSKLKEMKGRK